MTLALPVRSSPQKIRPPNQIAQALTGRSYLSWSQVNLMRGCPRRFSYQYVEKAPPEFVPSSLKFGTAIHVALETWFCGQLEGYRFSHDELWSAYRHTWQQEERIRETGELIPVRFNKTESADLLDQQAGRMLASFLASPLATRPGSVVAVEESLTATLDETLPDLVARVDLVWQEHDALHLMDFKTSRSRWNAAKVAQSADQLLLYHAMAQRFSLDADLPIQLHFGVLTKAKTPAVEIHDVPVDAGQIEQIITTIGQVWTAMNAGNFYPNPSPQSCTTCPYKSRCPAWARG